MSMNTNEPMDLWLSLLSILEKDGILLPSQTDVIRRIYKGLGQSMDVLLLGSGLISERTLQNYLQKLYGVNTMFDPFEFPTPEACELLTVAEVMQLNAIPQKTENGSVSVLIIPPIDPGQLEWIRARTQMFVVPLVTTPLRFHYILNHCYNVPMDETEHKTAMSVLEQIEPQEDRFVRPANVLYDPFSGPVEDISDDDDPLNLRNLPIMDRTHEVLDIFREELAGIIEHDLPSYMEATTSDALPESEIDPTATVASRRLDAAWKALESADIPELAAEIESREEIPSLFYSFGARAMRSVSLFTCTEGFAMGWTGAGLGVFPHRLEGIIVPEDRGTFIADIIQNNLFLGKAAPSVVNRRILQLLGADPEDILVGGAILLKERPVMVVVCVLDDEVAGPDEVQLLQELCQVAASIVLKLVRAKKAS
ncbi:hypothetical protein KJ975_04590 [Myxococcota bacterium]|nr:hypothetical protein [Myxococcota bacterium]